MNCYYQAAGEPPCESPFMRVGQQGPSRGFWLCERHWHVTRHSQDARCGCAPDRPWMQPKAPDKQPIKVYDSDGRLIGTCTSWHFEDPGTQPAFILGTHDRADLEWHGDDLKITVEDWKMSWQ